MAKELTHGSPARLIFFFSLPLLCGNAFQQIYSMVDTIIVGRTLGVGALAGVGATGSILFLILGFVIGMATGFSIICAQRFGARDRLGLRRSFLASLILCAFIAVVMTAGGVAAARPILVLMNTPADILGDAVSYLEITMWGVGVTLLFNILSSTITALGDSRSPLFFLIIACTLNIFLDLLFILSFGMGVGGAALATMLSQGISALLCAGFIVFKVPWLHFTSGDFRHLGRALNWRLLRTGLPMGFQTSVIAIGVIIIQAALNTLGTEAVAAFTSALRINSMGVMPLMSFGLAMATYTGQNLGAGRPDRILLGVRHGCYLALAYSCVAAAIAFLAGEPLMRVFVGQGQENVVGMGSLYLRVQGTMYWVLGLLFIFRNTLQGLGNSLVPTIAGIGELVMRFIAAFFVIPAIGIMGVCISSPMAWAGSCLPLAIAYFIWRHRRIRQGVVLVHKKRPSPV